MFFWKRSQRMLVKKQKCVVLLLFPGIASRFVFQWTCLFKLQVLGWPKFFGAKEISKLFLTASIARIVLNMTQFQKVNDFFVQKGVKWNCNLLKMGRKWRKKKKVNAKSIIQTLLKSCKNFCQRLWTISCFQVGLFLLGVKFLWQLLKLGGECKNVQTFLVNRQVMKLRVLDSIKDVDLKIGILPFYNYMT